MALARSAVKAARSAGDWKRMTVSIESVARRSTGLGKYDREQYNLSNQKLARAAGRTYNIGYADHPTESDDPAP